MIAQKRTAEGAAGEKTRVRGLRVYWMHPCRRVGRVAEGGGLLNRYRTLKFYRGFESPTLRHQHLSC